MGYYVGPENIPAEIVEDENEDIFNHTIFILNTYIKCIFALINLLLFIAKKECIKLHHKAFRADYILRSTKAGFPLGEFVRANAKFSYVIG